MTCQSACYSALVVRKLQIVCRALAKVLTILLLTSLLPVTPSTQALPIDPIRRSDQEASSVETEKDVTPLEQGKPIKRELAGGQEHAYQITLSGNQFLEAVVKQDGIDAVVQLFRPDGKLIIEFDSELRTRGQETVSWMAEETGTYRLKVLAKDYNVAAGQYEIQVVEVRPATDTDRTLHEARKLNTEFLRLYRAGQFDEANPLIERVLEIRQRALGPEHPDAVASLFNLATVYTRKGDYARAEPLFQRALAIREKAQEPEHPHLAFILENLATLYTERGNYEQAEQLYQRAMTIFEKVLGPEHPNFGLSLNSLASLYVGKGDYNKAEPLYRRALAILEKTLGPEHRNIAFPLNNLAIIYKWRGDYAKAEPLYQRVLAIREKVLGAEHPEISNSLNNLANLYGRMGDYTKAEPLFERALAIVKRSLGPEHPLVARYLSNLATIYTERGDYAKAEQLLESSLNIKEKALGPEHPNTATTIDNLGFLYYKRGDYAKAEMLYQHALAILEKSLKPEHHDIAEVFNDLAVLNAAKGDIAQAIAFLSRAIAVDEYNLSLNLATGSERQKIAYLALFSERTDFTLWLHSQAAPNDPQALNLAFTTLLRRKARGLDAMTDSIATLRRHATPEDKTLFDQLADARSQLAALIFEESNAINPETDQEQLKPLVEGVENLEVKLSARSAEFRAQKQPVTLAAVQAALPAASALVEFVVYTPQEPRTGKNQPPRYLAYLLAERGQPRWVDLGEAAPIDRAVNTWRQALRGNRVDAKRLAREVDEKVMRSVRSSLRSGQPSPDEIRHLLIAPDGPLNLIPFAALVDEQNRYLIERYTISYLTSGRDLLRLQDPPPSQSAPLVVANPLFGTPLFGTVASHTARRAPRFESPPAGRQGERQSDPGQGLFFRPLPGTKGEALAIKAVLQEASVLLQQEATEAALKRARAPRILHIATHGFFLGDQTKMNGVVSEAPLRISDLGRSRREAGVKEPFLSGLALSGANRGKDGDDDGVLTALEVAGLDLLGTRLVVLSACDTGLGEPKNGEGVQGLRRALVLAGSESQVMSLWPVTDEGAKELMIEYYRALQRGEGRSEGLRQVQLRMLRSKQWRHPFYWAAFIQSGEWANLDGRR
jgi:CHAT domain-containing protein/Tfp pilus assembly protein PilF